MFQNISENFTEFLTYSKYMKITPNLKEPVCCAELSKFYPNNE